MYISNSALTLFEISANLVKKKLINFEAAPCIFNYLTTVIIKLQVDMKPRNENQIIWCDKHQAAQILGLSVSSIKRLRLSGEFIENIHYVKYSEFCIRYNVELLRDWVTNRNTNQHAIAIENYLNSLPSNNQPKKRGRKVG